MIIPPWQVQKACEALRKQGFNEISTMECLQRVFQVTGSFLNFFFHLSEKSSKILNQILNRNSF